MQINIPPSPIPQCQHFKTNGTRCGSPALRNRKFCFFHQRYHDLRHLRRERPSLPLRLPLLEDANAVQISVQEVIDAVAEERLDPRRAGLMLYGLNTAACNLKNTEFEPRVLREQAGDYDSQSPVLQLLLDELMKPISPGSGQALDTAPTEETAAATA
jgi:hypothetical protein